jgi:hypothetical protein
LIPQVYSRPTMARNMIAKTNTVRKKRFTSDSSGLRVKSGEKSPGYSSGVTLPHRGYSLRQWSVT